MALTDTYKLNNGVEIPKEYYGSLDGSMCKERTK